MKCSTYQCLACGVEKQIRRNRINKYCSIKCQHVYQRRETFNTIEKDRAENAHQMKAYLLAQHGITCSCCGITEWNGLPLSMELEHKDGNGDNHTVENCCLLCPNCHSQTPTYKAKNKGNGRGSRAKALAKALAK